MKIKTKLPTSIVSLPILKEKVKIRPYTLKEEKIILLAKDATGEDSFTHAMVQIVDNCSIDMKTEAADLPLADLVFLFVQIRAKSVGEISELRFTCKKQIEATEDVSSHTCNGAIEYDLNLNDIEVSNVKDSDTVMIDPEEGLGIKLKYVSVNSMQQSQAIDDSDSQIKLLYELMICLFDNETIETKEDISFAEFKEFIEDLPLNKLKLVLDHINENPVMTKTIILKCPKCKNETEYPLKGVNDFF